MKPPFTRIAATFLLVSILSGTDLVAEEHAVFKSTDRGESWVRSDAGLPDGSRVNAFGMAGDTVFAGTDSGVYLSRDEAQSWKPATGVAMSSGRIVCFATLGETVFAGSGARGLLMSLDEGKSWNVNATFPVGDARCLLAAEGKIHVGTDADGVLVSNNNGNDWTRLSRGFPAYAQVFALAMVKGQLFAGLYSKGLYGWNPLTQRWTKAGFVSPLTLASIDGTLVAGHNPGGLYWSDDLGVSWSKGTAPAAAQTTTAPPADSGELTGEAPVWELASNDRLVIAGASTGIFHSLDHGRTWTRARRGLPAESPGVSFLITPTFILAGTHIEHTTAEDAGANEAGSNVIR